MSSKETLALPNRLPPLRQALRFSLIWLERLVAVDMLLFVIAMRLKLYWFNRLLSVPYMDMTSTDATIETGAVLMLAFWALLLPARGRLLALIGLNLVLSFLLFADVIYYRYFQDLITVPVLMQLGQVESLGGSITELLKPWDFWLFVDAVLLIPFAVYLVWKGRADLRSAASRSPLWRKLAIRVGGSAAAFMLGFALFVPNVNHATDTWAKGLFEKNWWNLSIYNVAGGLGFHGYDVYRYAQLNWFGAETVTAEQLDETEAWMKDRANARQSLEQDPLFGSYKGSNVLMVQMESLQTFMIGKSIGGKEITPVLNDLIEESAYFSRFYHQTSQGRTSDADFAVNCSLQPMKSGSVFIQYASHDFACLPETLKDNGYSATVFHPYQGGFWNRNVMYDRMEYDEFYSLKHFELDERLGWALGDKSFYRQSMDIVAELPQPFHAFMISLTSHHPYKLPAAQKLLNVEELDGTIMGDYLQVVHYADAALGELVERLKAEGLWENTILAVYGDHDNSIQQWELYERFMEDTSNPVQREQLVKSVPFLLHLPDGAHAGRYNDVGGQLDVTPTLLHLLGISGGKPYWLGSPLLTESESGKRTVTQRNGAWTDGELYFVPSPDGIPANGTCYSAISGEQLDTNVCLPFSGEADTELMMSDRIVIGDLLRSFEEDEAVEAMGGER
ncbi:LTA synthase family protein [Paenibacillus soyae]|uniref:LTA synthase family protein n=1 Tax=Paenibacillus soyae TaxID=2969249 RepID=A0A9X2MVA3_9BACL|nr:LTA synthase family protein [Paenibacillus soyae]MCR2806506.1 LTA synthase family protein [Paenibacillus soyae]